MLESMPSESLSKHATGIGLGIDAGGTQTRWALMQGERLLAEGSVAGFSALQINTTGGRGLIEAALRDIASAARRIAVPQQVRAGLTGLGSPGDAAYIALHALLADLFQLVPTAVALSNDMEIAYLGAFAPGEGYLIYAGTGSIGVHIDSAGDFHRVGGHGGVLDDGGSGFWIAREALRHIWRREDEAPGAWQDSPMAQAAFSHIGGSDWASSKRFIYGGTRGEIGQLARAIASVVDQDDDARRLLIQAGQELARLGAALSYRFGSKPLALGGRVFELHPIIETSLREALPATIAIQRPQNAAHIAAARMAVDQAATLYR